MEANTVGSFARKWEKKIINKVIEVSSDVLCALDQKGTIVYISASCQPVLGYDDQELLQNSFLSLISPEDHIRTSENMKWVMQGTPSKSFFNQCLHKTGVEVPIVWSWVWSEEDKLMYCLGRVASDVIQYKQKLQEKDEWHEILMKHGSDMIGLINEAGEYVYIGGAVAKTLGYQHDELMGQSVFDLIHPEDLKETAEAWERLKVSELVEAPDLRYKSGSGEWRWIKAIVSNQLKNPLINAFVISSKDITDEKEASLKLEESERRFRSLFDNNPDLIVHEDRDGCILDANPQFLFYTGFSKEDIVGKSLRDFLPAEVAEVYYKHLEEAFKGDIITFDMELPLSRSHELYLNITKIPIIVNGQVVGVHSIAKDITGNHTANALIKKQAETLTTVFESITDAVYMLDNNWHFSFINKEFEHILQLDRKGYYGKCFWEVFPELTNSYLHENFNQALQTGKSVHFETYMERFNQWFEVKAFPSDEGLSVYFSNITERVEAKRELEKLSLVASKISNGVIITDIQGRIEWVNEAFTRTTGFPLEEVKGQIPGTFILGPDSNFDIGQKIKEKLKLGKPFNIQTLNYRKSGSKVWLSMDFTPILNDEGGIKHHIIIQKDITFRKEAEEKQLQMTKDLYRQNRDFQQFTYIVSHNLRAPVANAMGLADFLMKLDKNSEIYDKSLGYLKTSVFKLDTVLRDLNLILSLRDQQDVVDREFVNLAEVCEQVRQNFLESLLQNKSELKVEIDSTITLKANRAYLYSIFYNLLSNAIKYKSESRPLQVNIKCVTHADGGVNISFSDNGSGFDMEKAGDNLFKLYKRFHKNKKGRGVGLFLVKTHVESMGGSIEMRSKLDEGTHIEILLPSEATVTPKDLI
ncbi:PAS domain S-box protein [Rufibacter tibetensis]|uniref:histidine kinase n=1 Tax=Rufibacter tibetensis TaxID=512763 RepID=A0A0P0C8X3_9BACT|nr:PAS domain S-box protein [Rufibacter tibetensis]ALI97809.1 hypothetical protein DC20_00950 [Rufibacter tibetensis]